MRSVRKIGQARQESGARKRAHRSILRLESLEERQLLSTTMVGPLSQSGLVVPYYRLISASGSTKPLQTAGPTGTTPTQIRHAYNFDQVTFNHGTVAGNGSGQTIAIVDAFDDPNIANDLHQFDLAFGLPDPVFTKVNQTGGSTPPAADFGWAVEIALDVEWAHAIAPKANILLVEATDSSFDNMYAAVRFAASQPGVSVVSMSWGSDEFQSETVLDSTFVTPVGHSGITFVASSGDFGAPAGYPSASPNVISVGGTTTFLDNAGNILDESGWSGSGGGLSSVEAQPPYQVGVVTQSTVRRATPDVAYDADPNTGFPVYDSFNNGTLTPWEQVGGTSDAAPQWSALIAIANQGRQLAGLNSLDGPTQTLPNLYNLPSGAFHDITSGSSLGSPTLSAGPGYDLVTGLGTPDANQIIGALSSQGAVRRATVTTLFAGSQITSGQALVLTATVAAGTGIPDGFVTFADGTTLIGQAPLLSGSAFFSAPGLGAGKHLITAFYSGSHVFASSHSTTLGVQVLPAQTPTTITVTSSVTLPVLNQSLVLTATVAPTGVVSPTGTVFFYDGANFLGSSGLTNGAGGFQATLVTSFLSLGTHSVTAIYSGDSANAASSAAPLQLGVQSAYAAQGLSYLETAAVYAFYEYSSGNHNPYAYAAYYFAYYAKAYAELAATTGSSAYWYDAWYFGSLSQNYSKLDYSLTQNLFALSAENYNLYGSLDAYYASSGA